jgi:hypothetical protein
MTANNKTGQGAKRKKSSGGTPASLAEDGSGAALAFAAGAAGSPAGSASGEAAGASATPVPFVFSAGAAPAASAAPMPAAGASEGVGTNPREDAAEAATQRLVEACRAGDPVAVAARLAAVADVNRPARQGAAAGFSAPPLWWSAEQGQADCVRILLAAGAHIEARPGAAQPRRHTRERAPFAAASGKRFLGLVRGFRVRAGRLTRARAARARPRTSARAPRRCTVPRMAATWRRWRCCWRPGRTWRPPPVGTEPPRCTWLPGPRAPRWWCAC